MGLQALLVVQVVLVQQVLLVLVAVVLVAHRAVVQLLQQPVVGDQGARQVLLLEKTAELLLLITLVQ